MIFLFNSWYEIINNIYVELLGMDCLFVNMCIFFICICKDDYIENNVLLIVR